MVHNMCESKIERIYRLGPSCLSFFYIQSLADIDLGYVLCTQIFYFFDLLTLIVYKQAKILDNEAFQVNPT